MTLSGTASGSLIHSRLDQGLRQACAYHGLAPWLNEWYRATTELDAELREFHPKKDLGPRPCRFPKRQLTVECTASPMGGGAVRAPDWPAHLPMLCFRCGQPGHWAAECLAPTPKGKSKVSRKTGKNPRKIPEKSRAAHRWVGPCQHDQTRGRRSLRWSICRSQTTAMMKGTKIRW